MEPRERILRTLNHEQVDIIPHWDVFSSIEAELCFLGEKYKRAQWWEKTAFISHLFDSDIVWIPIMSFGYCSVDPGIFCEIIYEGEDYAFIKNPFGGLHYCRKKPYFTRTFYNPIRKKEDLEILEKFNIENFKPKIISYAEKIKVFHDMGYFIMVEIKGPFATTWMFLRELFPFLIDIAKDPLFAKQLIEVAFEPIINFTEMIIGEWPVDAIRIAEDLGETKGPFFSIEKYRALFKPWHQEIVKRIHEKNVKAFLHSHGNVMSFFSDFVEVGYDCIDPLDPTDNMDLFELKRKHGEKITLMGGISKNIGTMSKEEIANHIQDRIVKGGASGYILFCAGGIPPEMSLENFIFYINTIRKYRKVFK